MHFPRLRSACKERLSLLLLHQARRYASPKPTSEIGAVLTHRDVNEINKALNAQWNEMSEENKLLYEADAFDDKERIKREVEKVRMRWDPPFLCDT